jgi:hypothetical protein
VFSGYVSECEGIRLTLWDTVNVMGRYPCEKLSHIRWVGAKFFPSNEIFSASGLLFSREYHIRMMVFFNLDFFRCCQILSLMFPYVDAMIFLIPIGAGNPETAQATQPRSKQKGYRMVQDRPRVIRDSTYKEGVISMANSVAKQMGVDIGMPAKRAADLMLKGMSGEGAA